MYWGDANLTKIETAHLNGTGRRTVLVEALAHYFAFVLHSGDLYFTDWRSSYVCLLPVLPPSFTKIGRYQWLVCRFGSVCQQTFATLRSGCTKLS